MNIITNTLSSTIRKTATAVEIKIEQPTARERRLYAAIALPFSQQQVWQVITDYHNFSSFIPSLSQSNLLNRSSEKIWLQQSRQKSLMGVNFSASSIFEIREYPQNQLEYQLVKGDFQKFTGFWIIKPSEQASSVNQVELIFDFLIVPKRIFPVKLVEHFLKEDVPGDLLGIRQRLEQLFANPAPILPSS